MQHRGQPVSAAGATSPKSPSNLFLLSAILDTWASSWIFPENSNRLSKRYSFCHPETAYRSHVCYHILPVFIAGIVNWTQHSAAQPGCSPRPSTLDSSWEETHSRLPLISYIFHVCLCLLQVLCPCPQNGKIQVLNSTLLNVWCMTPTEAAWRRKRRLERQAGRVYVDGFQLSDWQRLELGLQEYVGTGEAMPGKGDVELAKNVGKGT